MDVTLNWTDFKAKVAAKVLSIQYTESGVEYSLWAIDGADTYLAAIPKTNPASTDQTDFETNYKSSANKPITPRATDMTPYVRVTEKTVGKTLKLKGFELTCTANATSSHQQKLTTDIELTGGTAHVDTPHHGDKIQVKIVDVDNILGYGAGLVVGHIGRDIPAKMCEHTAVQIRSASALTVMAGLYLKVEYYNSHASEDSILSFSWEYFS